MSSKASMRKLSAGTKLAYTNDTQKPLSLVIQSPEISLRMTLAIGQSIDIDVGNANATLYLLEPEASEHGLQLVPPPSRTA